MSANTGSISTLDITRYFTVQSGINRDATPDEDVALPVDEGGPYSSFIQAYLPTLNGPIAWLPAVEAAIAASVPEEMNHDENEGQWLDADSAHNAIYFLKNTADLFPGYPSIYGTPLGDFVAEFESGAATLTSVVTPDKTLLVGVCLSNPDEQVQSIIPRGSNRLRDAVREFTKKLAEVHGEAVGSAR
ncbi:hypothetical protein RXV95_12640 [Novosphingobium sp. ZN18A2]|uniref:hypothetical protein n=1 Tax=Novosphingobium sp. ZN18A2 TaxID=3079861 RepID=UPI0030CBE4DF